MLLGGNDARNRERRERLRLVLELFDLKPEWEWFTSDGDDVMNALAPYENVTVLYGHIHRENFHQAGTTKMYAARSLIFAFPDPAMQVKKPMPFDKAQPFQCTAIITPEFVMRVVDKLIAERGIAQIF